MTGDIKSGAKEPWHTLQLAAYVIGRPDPCIQFEETGHRYFTADRDLVSVTKLVSKKNDFYAPGSAHRGHMVHRMCTLDAQGVLDDATVDPALLGYLTAWRKYRREMRPKFLALEQVVGDIQLGFAGRRDLDVEGPDDKAFVLYLRKTGTYGLEWLAGPQLGEKMAEVKKLCREYHEGKRLSMFEEAPCQ